MDCSHDLPQLVVVPVDSLILHEYHDEQRTPPLIENLRSSGVLRNPPIVIPLQGRTEQYMVLDGANRVSSFRKMGSPHILVQIINTDDPTLELNAWNHIVWGIPPDELFSAILRLPGVMLRPSTESLSFEELTDLHSLASLHLPDGKVFTAFSSTTNLCIRVRRMNSIVSKYIKLGQIDRTSAYQINPLVELYEDLGGLVMLPPFEVTEVMDVVSKGQLMPPGSTRFTIAPRVLHIKYPLSELESQKDIAEKNVDLQEYICALLAQKRVRFYEEPTFLFDE